MSGPVVSVVVPSYNHAQFLEQRLESILNQTFQDFELIILDDVSPDHSREIIENYRNHPKVSQIIFNEKNSGSTFFQWNKAILEIAKGDYIWIAESDDVAEPNFLECLLDGIQSKSDINIAFSQSTRMNKDGEITGDWLNHTLDLKYSEVFNQPFVMNGVEYLEKYLVYKNTIPNASAALFRRSTYIAVGGAEVDLKTNGDWDLWFKILLKGSIFYTPEKLNHFRYHNSSVIAKESTRKGNRINHKKKLYEFDLSMRTSIENYMINNDFEKITVFNINKDIRLKDKSRITMLGFLGKFIPL